MIKISKEKILYKNDWLSIREINGYSFLHEDRCNGNLVAVLGWRNNCQEILGRFEDCPAHKDGISLCSLTGGIDDASKDDDAILSTAAKELQEESGIKIEKNRFVSLGSLKPYKAADTKVHLFAVELPEENPVDKPKGDGSKGEKGSYCKWVRITEAINCKDPLVHSMIMRLKINL